MGIRSSLCIDVTILPSWRCTTRLFIFIPHICQHGRRWETFVLSMFCFERYNIANFVQWVSSQLENGVSSCHLPPNSEHRWAGRALDLKEWVHACNISLLWKMRQENHNLPSKLDELAGFHLKNKRIKKRTGREHLLSTHKTLGPTASAADKQANLSRLLMTVGHVSPCFSL